MTPRQQNSGHGQGHIIAYHMARHNRTATEQNRTEQPTLTLWTQQQQYKLRMQLRWRRSNAMVEKRGERREKGLLSMEVWLERSLLLDNSKLDIATTTTTTTTTPYIFVCLNEARSRKERTKQGTSSNNNTANKEPNEQTQLHKRERCRSPRAERIENTHHAAPQEGGSLSKETPSTYRSKQSLVFLLEAAVTAVTEVYYPTQE
jgi:hypothetical protein